MKGYTISEGHKYLYLPKHPKAKPNGYYAEHRYLLEKHLGRILKKEEIVHHKNHNGLDNRINNLEILSHPEHMKRHFSVKRMNEARKIKYPDGWHPDNKGKKNPNWKGGKIKQNCKINNCKKSWLVWPSLVGHKRYCTRKCFTLRNRL